VHPAELLDDLRWARLFEVLDLTATDRQDRRGEIGPERVRERTENVDKTEAKS